MRLLSDNGATLCSGDVGHFACTAVEQNNLGLLEQIVWFGGDVTVPNSSDETALHVAVSEDNLDIVKFLLDHGSNADQRDRHGWTPRDLADQQDHEEIKRLFESYKSEQPKDVQTVISSPNRKKTRFLGRFKSEPAIQRQGSIDGSWSNRHSRPARRRIGSNFYNSIFGIISAAHNNVPDPILSTIDADTNITDMGPTRPRVILSCPETGDPAGKLVLLPRSVEELLEIGSTKFGVVAKRILTRLEGAEVDDIEVIRDGDHLVLVSDNVGNS